MTALLVAYFFGYGTHIKKALRWYVTIAVLLIVLVQVSGPSLTYAQSTGEHDAAISSISDADIAISLGETESTTTGDTDTGTTVVATTTSTTYNDEVGSAVDQLNDLLALKWTYSKLNVFKWNNEDFYKLLRDRLAWYTTAGQAAKFVSIVDKLDILNDAIYELYGLNKAGLMDVLPGIADDQRELITDGVATVSTPKKKWESFNTDDLTLEYELFYGVSKATAWLPIVFHMDNRGPTNIKRATWDFWNGKKYTCNWNQCGRVGVMYSGADTYQVVISFRYANGETGRQIFKLDVKAATAEKPLDSRNSKRTLVDVMNTKAHGTEEVKNDDNNNRVMFRWGKVNQHTDAGGDWQTDPDGISGNPSSDAGRLAYCKKRYADTVKIETYKMETIDTWKERGNVNNWTSTKQSYICISDSDTVDNSVSSSVAVKITQEPATNADDTQLDSAFESLLVSIFGQ